jgi:hypothetical protein
MLFKLVVILLSIWSALWAVLWLNFGSGNDALGIPSATAGDILIYALPLIGWILVIAVWAIREAPWRSDTEDEGVWVGNTFLPDRTDKE